ncbi:hypothetical protein GC105_13440 [Alkalibaculum sp. M08DMB]|uniref:VanZ-like domain-containing protein n=1 Tax=Alkalibaculum sporogenes TaxID=2655001 RepID=A0A6A7KB60_9FIRM|nr:VanZ family protein [Alkalibaculum sporogenes]MPW26789.1 hypothetical protein [Alkalibaculum sporogenes]
MLHIDFYIILLATVPSWLWYRNRIYAKNKMVFNIYRELIANIFFVYLLSVAYLTLKPFTFIIPFLGGSTFRGSFDTNLFYQLTIVFRNNPQKGILFSLGNILMFVPFGALSPILFKRARSFLNIIVLGFSFSLTIELTQTFFTFSRLATVDDLFFNTLGAAIGFMLFSILKSMGTKLNFINKFTID